MDHFFKDYILQITNAQSILKMEPIQELWSGYGQILRVFLQGASSESVVVKWMNGKGNSTHPRGWNNSAGHQRKLRSYEVENFWYQNYGDKCSARIPRCFGFVQQEEKSILILEDLNLAGFPIRLQQVNPIQFENCIEWLAKLHASFMNVKPEGLWETGSYWHLATREEELDVLDDQNLKNAAPAIDKTLSSCKYQTLIHGDAKLANFCFGEKHAVAGVDFQYVGGGCGMKDLVYFVGSCLPETECERQEERILNFYFQKLQEFSVQSIEEIEQEWRPLYRVAWADFHRFLKGWSPTHWKINSYSERITCEVVNQYT